MGEALQRWAWRLAAADPALLPHCRPAEQRAFSVVGALVLLQCVLVGTGCAEALLLAAGGHAAPAGFAVYLAIGGVVAVFWSSVVRLSLVNMGRGIPTARRHWLRLLPNLYRLAMYAGLGGLLSVASLVPVLRLAGVLRDAGDTGILSLAREALRHGGPTLGLAALLLLVFVLPVILRAFVPLLADGDYERAHVAQLQAVVAREVPATLQAWAARMAPHQLGPARPSRALREVLGA